MAVSYENARNFLGKKSVWERSTGEAKEAISATLRKVTRNVTSDGPVVVLTLATDDPDEPIVHWDGPSSRPVVNKDTDAIEDTDDE